jgi:cytochrome c biogenesis protein CcmG/thiol:disulfide interchange protein DsbE
VLEQLFVRLFVRGWKLGLMRTVLFACLMGLTACGRPSYPPTADHPLVRQPLPQIRHRQTLDGQPVDAERFAGKTVLVKFFADYCKPCQETLPAAERLHQAYPDVVFLGIAEDDDVGTARRVVQRYGITFPVIHDTSNVLSGRFRVSAMPMTFVADRGGVIRWVGRDGQTEADLKRAIEASQ